MVPVRVGLAAWRTCTSIASRACLAANQPETPEYLPGVTVLNIGSTARCNFRPSLSRSKGLVNDAGPQTRGWRRPSIAAQRKIPVVNSVAVSPGVVLGGLRSAGGRSALPESFQR